MAGFAIKADGTIADGGVYVILSVGKILGEITERAGKERLVVRSKGGIGMEGLKQGQEQPRLGGSGDIRVRGKHTLQKGGAAAGRREQEYRFKRHGGAAA